MFPRAHRWILGSALLLFLDASAVAAEPGVRANPARPGTVARLDPAPPARPSARKPLSVPEIAAQLGLKVSWTRPGAKAVLSDATRRLVLEGGSRETAINGLRVFLGNPVTVARGQLYVSPIDFETCLVPLLKPSLIAHRLPRPKIIALDAGHGGVDQGTGNRRLGYKEKTYTLDITLRLKKLLEKQGYTVVLTRAKDVTVDKVTRVLIANQAGADLFVSIHLNALLNDQNTRGTEVFTFAPPMQRSTNSWGVLQADDTEREGSPGNKFDPWNSLLAHSIHRELLAGLKTFDRGKKIGHLGVLRGLNCPGVLVESGFLSNDDEARKLGTADYRQETAVALAAGIEAYARQLDALRLKR